MHSPVTYCNLHHAQAFPVGWADRGEEEGSQALEGLFSFGATKQSGSAPISRALHSAPLTFLREGGGFGGSGLTQGDGGVVLARADTADLLSLLDAVIQGEEVRRPCWALEFFFHSLHSAA